MSAREEVRIGPNVFHVRRFEAFKALKILGDLQKQFVAPLLSMLDGKEAGSETAITAALMGGAERVLRDMDGDKLEAVARKLLDPEYVSVSMPGEETRKLDTMAIGLALTDVADLIELCIAIARVNYASVFTRAASLIGAARQSPSTEPFSASLEGSRPN